MAVTFMLDARPNKAGEHPIRVSICIRRVRLQTSIGFSVAKDKWVAAMPDSPRKEKEVKSMHYVIPNTVNSVGMKGNEMNAKLLKIKTHFDEYERTLERLPTKDDLSSELDIALNRKELKQEIEIVGSAAITIQDRLKEFVREQSIACQWAYATLQAWKTFSNHLSKFGKRVTFDDFNEDGLNKFIRFLLSKAGDFTIVGLSAEESRQRIIDSAALLPHNIRLEADVSWLHIDVLPQYGVTDKVYLFRG